MVVPEETGVGGYPNAFATGRRSKPTVGVTEGLLRHLDDDEIYGVLGHELAHVKNRDTLVMTVAAAVSTAIAYAFDPWLNAMYTEDWEDIAFLVLAGMLASLISTLLVAAISRRGSTWPTRRELSSRGTPWRWPRPWRRSRR